MPSERKPLVRRGAAAGKMRASGLLTATALLGLLAGCRTVHVPAAETEDFVPVVQQPREVAEALSRSLSGVPGVPMPPLEDVPQSSTGIILLRPTVPRVPATTRLYGEGEGPGEPLSAEPDVMILREAWPNPVARGGVPSVDVGLRFDPVRFAYDSVELDFIARQAIESYGRWLVEHPEIYMTLEGHCDERGSSEYNYNLAMARAWAVKDAMVGAGVLEDRLYTISYGEEQPIALGSSPQAYALNRRVELRPFYPSREGRFLSTLREAPGPPQGRPLTEIPPPQNPVFVEGDTGWPELLE